MIEKHIPVILSDGSDANWIVNFSESPPWRLSLKDPKSGTEWSAVDDDLYSCLLSIRMELEHIGVYLRINGSRVDARPSPMLAQMAGGSAVYLLESRKFLRRIFPTLVPHKMVDIFDPAPKGKIGTVDDQKRFFQRYLGWN